MSTELNRSPRPGWWAERTAWGRLKQVLLLEPLPGGARWAAAFGSLLLFAFVVQVVTGILLALNYAPSERTAWASVKFIQDEVPLGWFIRAVHHWGSSAMVVLLLVHLIQVFVWGAYKRPREFTWMTGVLLLICTLGLAFTGYLLPWDQKAYWATKVGLGMISTVPGIGAGLRTLLQGGPELGNLTLTRFFTIHGFVLPGLVILLVVVHLYLFRVHGVTPPWWISPAELQAEEPFWPHQAWKDAVLALVFLVGLGVWSLARPAPLEVQAAPAQPYEARPEWYFMFLFQLLRYFHGPAEVVGTFVLPLAFFLILFFWPWLDRNPHRSPGRRPLAMTLLGAAVAGLIGLTVFAVVTDVRVREPAVAARTRAAPPPAGPIQRLAVAALYTSQCVACHGVDGSGQFMRRAMPTIPDFTSLAWQMSQTDLDITHRILDGNEPLMPAFRHRLTRDQNLALTIYVRAFAVEPTPPTAPHAAPPPAAAATAQAVRPPTTPAATAQAVRPPTTPAAPAAAAPAARPISAQMSPAQIYRAYCLACHDADGRGRTVRRAMPAIPDFTAVQWQRSRSDAELSRSIAEGKGKFMLPMKDRLGPTDVAHMVAYVRAFQGSRQTVAVAPLHPSVVAPVPTWPAVVPPPPAPPRQPPAIAPAAETAARTRVASVLYRQYCLMCHGANGTGGAMRASMPDLPDFTDRGWQESRTRAQIAVSILDGKGTLMPAFRDRIVDDQAQDLVAYVRAFGPPAPAPAARAPASDFERRYRQLQDQLDTLERQLREVSPPPRTTP